MAVTISTVYHACKVGHFPKIRSKSDLDAVPGVQRCAQGVFSVGLVFGWSFLLYLSEVDFFWITAHWIYDFFIMFRPLILEHFWDTRGTLWDMSWTLWDMSWNTLGHVPRHVPKVFNILTGFSKCMNLEWWVDQNIIFSIYWYNRTFLSNMDP